MADLEAIRRVLSIPDVAERLGIDVPRKGDATCPRHKGQSLRLKEDYFYCHGGCADHGGKGDIFNLVMFTTSCSFADALVQCAGWAGIRLEYSQAEQERVTQRRQSEDLLSVALDFYRSRYDGSPAHAYAQQRGLDHPEAALGYAPDSWTSLVDHFRASGVGLEAADRAGLISISSRKTYIDTFRSRLIIPTIEAGRVTYLQGRAITAEQLPKYCNTAMDDPPLYHVNGALKTLAPTLCESTTDTLRLSVAGVPALGTFGAALKEQQRRRLERFELIYVAGQNDNAGRLYVDEVARKLGERVKVVMPPDGHKGWDEALDAGLAWSTDTAQSWVRWKAAQIPPDADQIALRKALAPITSYLATIAESDATIYLEELQKRYKWSRPVYQQYLKAMNSQRTTSKAAQRPQSADVDSEDDELGESLPPPIFISPALAFHNGVTYVSQMMAFRSTKKTKNSEVTIPVWRPVIISSQRQRLLPTLPPLNAPEGAITWLDEASNLALRGGFHEAAEGRWSYENIVAYLQGHTTPPKPHEVYDALMTSLKQYVYHSDETSYVVDVLWTLGTYFHQLFQAFPYLALHGARGAGKSTLLTWLAAIAFNARPVVNTSEASLYRSIQAQSPTLLIDEQEGLNNSKAAKENKADLMGILKSGYKKGMTVQRQRIDRPDITESFEVYSPKALAAIEHFEDVLESRAILTFMHEKPSTIELVDGERILSHDRAEFGPLRDQCYLLLMHHAADIVKIAERVQFKGTNRFRELFKPLFAIAALVDWSRGDGQRQCLALLETAADAKLALRTERDGLTPEAMLREALRAVCDLAVPGGGDDDDTPERTADGKVLADALHIKEVFESLFSNKAQSFFNDSWMGKQAQKLTGIKVLPRYRRKVKEWSDLEREGVWVVKRIVRYELDPAAF